MLPIAVLLSLVTTVSGYTIVLTSGNRSTGIPGMLYPLYTVQLATGETLTDAQKVQAYQDWQSTTSNYLSSTGNTTTAAYRDAMFCYSGPALYPAATDTLPPIPTCSDYITVYNNTVAETNDLLSQLNNSTRKAELMANGQYDTLLEEQDEKLRLLQSYFPNQNNAVLANLTTQVETIINTPSAEDIVNAAVQAILGNSTNQTQIDQARMVFFYLLSENKTSFNQTDINDAMQTLYGSAGGALNSTTLAAITKQMQNSTWVTTARGSLYPGDSFIDEIVTACGNSTYNKNFTAFLNDLVYARSQGQYNSTVVSRFLSQYFGDLCSQKVPGLPFRVWWWTSGNNGTTFLSNLLSTFTSRNASTISQARSNTWYDVWMSKQNEVATNVSNILTSVSSAANATFTNAVNSIANFFKAFG